MREGGRAEGDAGWWSFVRRSKTPELPVVLLEDIGPWWASCWPRRRGAGRRTQHLGPDELLVAAKIGVDAAMTLGDVSVLVDGAEARVRGAVKDRCVMYLEPDVAASTRPGPQTAAG